MFESEFYFIFYALFSFLSGHEFLQLCTRLDFTGLVSNRPKRTRAIFNSNDLFLLQHLIFLFYSL